MKPGQNQRVCPACGARNKPKWEFCIRCGESLAAVQAGEPSAPAQRAPEKARDVASDWPAYLQILGVALALFGVGAYFWRSGWTRSTPEKPNPGIFAMATPAPAAPSSRPVPAPRLKLGEARRLLGLGERDKALALLEELIAEEPGSIEIHDLYGRALWDGQRREEALVQFRLAAEISPRTHQLILGRYLVEAGQREEALRAYEAAFVANPEDAVVAQEYGTLLSEAKQFDQAAVALRRALAARPFDSELKAALALALEPSDREEASAIYRELLDQDGGRVVARVRLAELAVAKGDREEAVRLYREGLKLNPAAPSLHQGLGEILERMGQLREAAAAYREYSRLAPNAPSAKAVSARAEAIERRIKGGKS